MTIAPPDQKIQGIKVELVPWIGFVRDGFRYDRVNIIPHIDEAIDGGLIELKQDRSKVSLGINPEKLHNTSENVANIAKENGFEALGYFAVKITSPKHPEIDNTAVHYVLMIQDINDGSLHAIPYGNSVGNECIQGNVDPTKMETLITYFHNYLLEHKWRYDPETGTITEDDKNGVPFKTMGFYFPNHDNYVDSSGETRIPRTAEFLLDADRTSPDRRSAVRQKDRGFSVAHFQTIYGALAYVMTQIGVVRDDDQYYRLLTFAAKAANIIQKHEANPGHNPDGTEGSVRATPEQRKEAIKLVREYSDRFFQAYIEEQSNSADPLRWVNAVNDILPLNLSHPALQEQIVAERKKEKADNIEWSLAYVRQSGR